MTMPDRPADLSKEDVKRILQERFDRAKAEMESASRIRKDVGLGSHAFTSMTNIMSSNLTRAAEISQVADDLGVELEGKEGFLLPEKKQTEAQGNP